MSSVFNSTESQPGLIWTAVGRHTDWFLHHKERGVKNLGALIAAELAIIAFYFTHTAELQSINRIVGLVLLLAGLLGIPLVRLAITSATRSFQAAMECISLASKCLWAMGLTARLTLNPDSVDTKNIPAPEDLTPFVPRYTGQEASEDEETTKSPTRCATTKEFVSQQLQARNTFGTARWALVSFSGVALFIGIAGAALLFTQ